jgi:hypothetical protein
MRCAAVLSLFLSGCASSVVRSGLPPGRTATGFDERWHAAFFFGTISAGEGYDVARLCPEGWSEIRLSPDEFTFAAGLFTAFLYSPSRLTVICASRDALAPPKLGSYPPPRRDNGAAELEE